MVINAGRLYELQPIKNMNPSKKKEHGVSFGLSEAGYDIRIKQSIEFREGRVGVMYPDGPDFSEGRFVLASTIEEFQMPTNLVGIVHDKSTWARRSLSVFNTVIEPGWKGWLTLELVYHGQDDLVIPAGSGIAQVIFHELAQPMRYAGLSLLARADSESFRGFRDPQPNWKPTWQPRRKQLRRRPPAR